MERSIISCASTGATVEAKVGVDGTPTLPRGWRRVGGRFYSPKAWSKAFVTRTLTLPVAAVVTEGGPDADWGRKMFISTLTDSYRAATEFANACWTWLVAHDVMPLLKEGEKRVSLPRIDPVTRNAWLRELYALGAKWPVLETATRTAIRNRVWSDYRRARFNIRVRFAAVGHGYRHPFPLPFPADAGKVKMAVDPKNAWISLRLRLGGEAFWVRLSGHPRYRYQTGTLRRIGDDAVLGSVTLRPRRVFSADHHRSNAATGASGEQRRARWQTVALVAVHLPVERPQVIADQTLIVRSTADCLLRTIEPEHQRTWTLHADEARRLVAHAERLRRLVEHRNAERPLDRARRIGLRNRTRDLVVRHARWQNDLLHKVSRSVVEWALHRRCATVRLDLTEPFSPNFPWFRLRALIEEKCRAAGIAFDAVPGAGTTVRDGIDSTIEPSI